MFRRLCFIFLWSFLLACTKNDPAPSIVGTWKEKSVIVSGCTNTSLNGSTTCGATCISLIIDSKTVSTNGGAPAPYSISGGTITLMVGSTYTSSTYTVTATTLTIITQYPPAVGGCLNVTTFTRVG